MSCNLEGVQVISSLFFMHNPKTGGTSVLSALQTLFDRSDQCPRIENDATEHALLAGQYRAYAGYRFYAGHYGRDIHQGVGEQIPVVTNFRWPVARILSLYSYFRHVVPLDAGQWAQPRYRAVRLAKTLSLDDFATCDDPSVEIHTADHHYRQLTASGWSATLCGDEASAKAFIDAMPWFLVCEHPQASLIWAQATFEGRVGPLPCLNETGAPKAALGARAYRVLDAKNQRDLVLYRHALDRLMLAASPAAAPVRETVRQLRRA